MREQGLKRRFGMTLADYDEMLERQCGGCAICGTHDTAPYKHFGVDHDHATGAVRGLLCHGCNSALGRLHDEPELLRAAADYLDAA